MAPRDAYLRERHVAELAVLRASILTKQVQSTVKEISKDDDSPVTVADFAAQAIIIGTLRNAFPDDEFLGEENSGPLRSNENLSKRVYELVLAAATSMTSDATGFAVDVPQPSSVEEMLDWIDLGGGGQGGDQGRFWAMDPVDGTAAFLKGQQYAVSLALINNGKEVVGVLGCPNISAHMTRICEDNVDTLGFGIMLTAVRGQGATLRTMTREGLGNMPVRPLGSLEIWTPNEKLHIVGCTACPVTRHDVIAKLADNYHVKFPNTEIWSSHIRYAALVLGGGNAQFWIPAGPSSKIHIWDHAGSQLIFTELGGTVTDLNSKPVDFGAGRDFNRNKGLVVARRHFHPAVLASVRSILGEERDEQPSLVMTKEHCFGNGLTV